jgi:hypothetical protein
MKNKDTRLKCFFETGDKTLAVPLKLRQTPSLRIQQSLGFYAAITGNAYWQKTLSGFRLGRDGHLKKLAADSHQPSVLCAVSEATFSVITFENMCLYHAFYSDIFNHLCCNSGKNQKQTN